MGSLDLRGIVTLNEGFMGDSCTITRDTELTEDDVWDESSGTFTSPAGDITTVYDGSCFFYSRGQGRLERVAGRAEQEAGYIVEIPLSVTTLIKPEDSVTCTAVDPVNGDTAMIGKVFRVLDVIYDSYATSRRINLTLIQPVP